VIDRAPALTKFREAYAAQRAAEGRHYADGQLLSLPYLFDGPLAKQWQVRARTFDSFMRNVLQPAAARKGSPLDVLDLGAGNGWLSYRVALRGHRAVAIDMRHDEVDGLGAGRVYVEQCGAGHVRSVASSFDALPLRDRTFDMVVFNASLHYATDLPAVIAEAARVCRAAGRVVILDSPFYRSEKDGLAMVEEKHREADRRFGERSHDLMALPFVEFLTEARLAEASEKVGLRWRHRRVRYPLWYEVRPLVARWHGRRRPSRFDLWEAIAS
jgi:SAM-dependent methyltransferase